MSKYSMIYKNSTIKYELVFRNQTFDYTMLPCEFGTKGDKPCFADQLSNTFDDLDKEQLDEIFDAIENATDEDEIFESMEELDSLEKKLGLERTCYNCINYYTSTLCAYNASCCKVHGSLDLDQHERHPDTAAETCREFIRRK